MNYTLKVAEVRKETSDTVTICFRQPGLKKIKYEAGQYLSLIFNINGRKYIRPYSFSSSPAVDSFLEITVKRVINGIISNHINDLVKEGDVIEVLPPMGDFTFVSQKNMSAVYLWGSGSGITPLISLAKQTLFSEQSMRVYLLYGNKNYESTIFANQIQLLQEEYKDRFYVRHFHTQAQIDPNNPLVIQGRIGQKVAGEILSMETDLPNTAHYICGPTGLKESVKKAILEKQPDFENIYSEDFELIKNPVDFEAISTREVTLNFLGQEHRLEIVKGKSILEAALDANIELPYSCQTGNCSICKGQLTSGEVKMIGLSNERPDLSTTECLVCCSHPLTDNVYIVIK